VIINRLPVDPIKKAGISRLFLCALFSEACSLPVTASALTAAGTHAAGTPAHATSHASTHTPAYSGSHAAALAHTSTHPGAHTGTTSLSGLLPTLSLCRGGSLAALKFLNGLLNRGCPGTHNPDISLLQRRLSLGTHLTGNHGLGACLHDHLSGLNACALSKIHVLVVQPLVGPGFRVIDDKSLSPAKPGINGACQTVLLCADGDLHTSNLLARLCIISNNQGPCLC
jgi:hypothetical protein